MIKFNQDKNEMKLTIPLSGVAELYDYQMGLLGVLSRIEVEKCNTELREDVKSVYKLLSHLLLDAEFLDRNAFLLKDYKGLLIKCPEKS